MTNLWSLVMDCIYITSLDRNIGIFSFISHPEWYRAPSVFICFPWCRHSCHIFLHTCTPHAATFVLWTSVYLLPLNCRPQTSGLP